MSNSSKPTTAEIVGGQYNVTAPTLVNGQGSTLQLDVNGNLKTTGGGGSSNASVGPTGTIAPTSATEIGIVDNSGNLQNVSSTNPLPITGSISASNPSVGTTGTTAPTSATEMGIIVGGNLQGVSSSNPVPTTLSGSPTVDIQGHAGATLDGIAGTPSTGVLTVQGVSGGTAQPVSGTVTSDIVGHAGAVLDGTAGTPSTGVLTVQGVSGGTSVPTTLSGSPTVDIQGHAGAALDGVAGTPSAGVLTVQGVSGGTAQPVSGTVTSDIVGHAGATLDGTAGSPSTGVLTVQGVSGGTAQPVSFPSDASPATVNITTQDVASTTTSQANSQNAITGTPTAGSAASFAVSSIEGLVVQVTGTWTGTLATEVSFDGGTTWFASGMKQYGTSYFASSFTANFTAENSISGATNVRVRSTAAQTGTAVVLIRTTQNPAVVRVSNPIKIQDGTTQSISDTIKAASTAAVATDTALVVGLSPNSNTITQGTAAALTAGWPVTAAQPAESTAAWTSSTTVNTALAVTIQGYSTVVVTLSQGTTLTGGTITFEASDTTAFTNAYGINGVSIQNLNTKAATFSFIASTNSSLVFNVAGFAAFRVRLSTVISGTGTVNVGIQASNATAPFGFNISSATATATVNTSTAATAIADNDANVNILQDNASHSNPLYVATAVYGGAFSGTANAALSGWSKNRTPTVFKTASAVATASGNTAVWTPGTNNKFRLLGFQITAQGLSATAAGLLTVSFQDSSTGITIGTYDVDIPAAAGLITGVSNISGGWIPLGSFGYLSSAANNVLNFNVSATLTGATGTFRINVAGTEE